MMDLGQGASKLERTSDQPEVFEQENRGRVEDKISVYADGERVRSGSARVLCEGQTSGRSSGAGQNSQSADVTFFFSCLPLLLPNASQTGPSRHFLKSPLRRI